MQPSESIASAEEWPENASVLFVSRAGSTAEPGLPQPDDGRRRAASPYPRLTRVRRTRSWYAWPRDSETPGPLSRIANAYVLPDAAFA